MTEEREPAYMDPEIEAFLPDVVEPFCSICGGPMVWESCWNGCDDGYIDLYEEDPLWYDDDDIETCRICGGAGGYWQCLTPDRHVKTKEPAP